MLQSYFLIFAPYVCEDANRKASDIFGFNPVYFVSVYKEGYRLKYNLYLSP